jgi:hypothetical protein
MAVAAVAPTSTWQLLLFTSALLRAEWCGISGAFDAALGLAAGTYQHLQLVCTTQTTLDTANSHFWHGQYRVYWWLWSSMLLQVVSSPDIMYGNSTTCVHDNHDLALLCCIHYEAAAS